MFSRVWCGVDRLLRKLSMRILSFWPNWINLPRPARALPCAMALLLLTAAFSSPAAAITHARVHRVRHTIHPLHRFTLAHFNPVFPGSHELLVQQNVELDKLQLPRINDDYELMKYELSQDLVPVSESDALKIAANLPDNRRYCRPWTRDFLEDFSQAFYNEFHQPIQVNSLVRTVEQQHALRRYNRFAAPEFGDTASTHLTGVTADLSRRGFTKAQYTWVRAYLMPLHEAGLVDPIEESQPVLHIVVYDKYSPHTSSDEMRMSEANEPGEFPLNPAIPTR
jgi:Family of unknown function (DUF5715)